MGGGGPPCPLRVKWKLSTLIDLLVPNSSSLDSLDLCIKGDVASQLRKCMLLVQIQAAITGFLTFYWSGRTASPLLIQ